MALETVTRFADGGVPTEAEMNELLDALKVLLNSSGLPSTAFPWPLIAQGNIDMNGFDILNVTDVGGVINVNSAKSLSSAVSSANASGDTKIIIDPGYTATVTTAGLAITGDNITIEGSAGSQIDCVEQAVTRDCITVTGNGFRLYGIEFISTGAGTKITDAVFLKGVEDAMIHNNVFSQCYGGIRVGPDGATNSSKIIIEQNIFDTQPDECIVIDGGDDVVITGNIGLGMTNNNYFIHIDGISAVSLTRITISDNTGYSGTAGSKGIKISGGADIISELSVTGNAVNTVEPALFLQDVVGITMTGNNFTTTSNTFVTVDTKDSTVSSNIFTGNLTYRDDAGVFSQNVVTGIFTVDVVTGGKMDSNIFEGATSLGASATDLRVTNNQFSNALAVSPTGIMVFMNNTCNLAITGLATAGAGVDNTAYANNVSLIGEVS